MQTSRTLNTPSLTAAPARFGTRHRKPDVASGNDFFCRVWKGDIPDKKIMAESGDSFAVLDDYAVSKGHTLIVPKRHFANLFDATPEERADLFALLEVCRDMIVNALKAKNLPLPTGWNVGVNVGKDAGQTVEHLHVHLIPRYEGDMEDPTGGVRGVIPEKQKYTGDPDRSVDKLLD